MREVLFGSIVQTLGDVLNYPLGVLVEQGVVLDDDQGVAGLFKNGHELEYCKSSADPMFWNLRSNRLKTVE